ncbi:MAG: ABC transporter substrate-binding protein [Anaerolineaceae bacterium]|nr:ABC transporter substrate-binding protein [Anaerolineaceae bacterium]
MKKNIRMVALVFCLAVVLCTAAAALADSNKLTVYTAFPESEVIYYFNKFTAETGIQIEYIRLSAGEMLTRVEAEKENPQAALMFGGSTDNYIAAAARGLFEPYQSPELANTPQAYLDPTGTWNPIYVGCIAFACNSDWFKENGYEYPKTWEDLLDPKYEGEIIMAHPATSGTAYTVLATLIQLKGEEACWDYMSKLSKNISQFTKAGSAAPNAVALGEAAIALTFSHDALQLTPEGYHIELSFPEDGTGYEVGAVALIKNGPADEQENAKKFIDWICSVAGQGSYAENDSFRVPTNTQAPVADGLVTLDQVPVIDYDAVWASNNKSKYCAEFEEKIVAKPES